MLFRRASDKHLHPSLDLPPMKGALPYHSFKGGEIRPRTPSPARAMLSTFNPVKLLRRRGRIIVSVFLLIVILTTLLPNIPQSPYNFHSSSSPATQSSPSSKSSSNSKQGDKNKGSKVKEDKIPNVQGSYVKYRVSPKPDFIHGIQPTGPRPLPNTRGGESPFTEPMKVDSKAEGSSDGLKVAIINTPRYHFEVVLPILHTFASQQAVSKIELFSIEEGITRLGANPLLHRQLPQLEGKDPKKDPRFSYFKDEQGKERPELVIRDMPELQNMGYVPDVIVYTSCSRDLEDIPNLGFLHPEDPNSPQEIVCLMHESEEWTKPDTKFRKIIDKWVKAGRANMLVLSPHVRDFVTQRMDTEWNMGKLIEDEKDITSPGVRMMHPIIPIFEDKDMWDSNILNHRFPGPFVAIPGKYEAFRRNYNQIFSEMTENASNIRGMKASLRISGFGPLPLVPPAVHDLVKAHSQYDFPQYFSLLSKAIGIMPAFAHHKYLEDRASSTVATAVIAGVPMIATKELVEKYSYLDETTAWVQEEGESDVAAWMKALAQGPNAWAEKREKVKALRKTLIRRNIRETGKFLEHVKERKAARKAPKEEETTIDTQTATIAENA